MTCGDYVLALGLYGAAVVLVLEGLYALAYLVLARWGGPEWRNKP